MCVWPSESVEEIYWPNNKIRPKWILEEWIQYIIKSENLRKWILKEWIGNVLLWWERKQRRNMYCISGEKITIIRRWPGFFFLIVRSHPSTHRPVTPIIDWSGVWTKKKWVDRGLVVWFETAKKSGFEAESPPCLVRVGVPSQTHTHTHTHIYIYIYIYIYIKI